MQGELDFPLLTYYFHDCVIYLFIWVTFESKSVINNYMRATGMNWEV